MIDIMEHLRRKGERMPIVTRSSMRDDPFHSTQPASDAGRDASVNRAPGFEAAGAQAARGGDARP